ncbi:MAG: response regulator [Candidatus Riflebacteria bacterium]|nr:response regulator [Candidatus Riflebacteria bacterium]
MDLSYVKVLLIESNQDDVKLLETLRRELKESAFQLELAENFSVALDYLSKKEIDIILLGLDFSNNRGLSTLRVALSAIPYVPIIVLTGFNDEQMGIDAVREGAQDYLVKGQIDSDLLTRSIRFSIERAKSEKRLREAELRYRRLFEQFPDGIIIIDPETFLPLEFNHFACSQLGFRKEEFSKLKIFDYHLPAKNGELKLIFDRNKNDGRGDLETQLFSKKGEKRDVLMTVQNIILSGKMFFQCVIRDITDLKRSSEERRKLEERIMQSRKLESLAKLAGKIAHDFNNILTGIFGYADIAIMALPPNSVIRDYIQKIVVSARNAGNLSKEMLALTGKGKLMIQNLQITDLFKQIKNLLENSVPKNCDLKISFPENLPTINGDFSQIMQAIINLVTNSVEAIGPRDGKISINSGIVDCNRAFLRECQFSEDLQTGKYLFIEVLDSGCGITQEIQQQIFDPFFSTKLVGRGLGLPTVYGIVRGHKGTIKVTSEIGNGTSVKLFFPIIDKGDEIVEKARETAKMIEEWRSYGKILVIEDDDFIRSSIIQILKKVGFTTLDASNGQAGITAFQSHSPDVRLVLLDLTMPDLGGEETFRELKKIKSDVPIILTSGYSEEEATNNFDKKDLADFLQKPYSFDKLISKIKNVLEKHSEDIKSVNNNTN